MTQAETPVIDYEGSKYRTDFWEGKGRNYEDQVERIALRRLLPAKGRRALELGAAFGRLTPEFQQYDQVILLDYSRSLLAEAQARLGKSDRFIYVAANIYRLPIADGVCDVATLIRVVHHLADAPTAFKQIRAALAPGGVFVLEFANKRNLKAMLRYLVRRQKWSPYSKEPFEYIKLNFDFHPHYIYEALAAAQFKTERKLAVSYFRLGLFKKVIPNRVLVALDSFLQPSGALVNLSPSVFTRNQAQGQSPATSFEGPLFKCPACGSTALTTQPDRVVCEGCQAAWSTAEGIFDFREPLK